MFSSKRLALGALAICLGVVWQPGPAVAEGGEDPARAEAIEKYKRGSQAFAEKRYKDAIELFLEADGFVSSPALAYNTALAYEAMGDTASALRWAREYLRRAPSAEDRREVSQKIATFEGRLQEKGVQQVTVISVPLGATVLIDGRPLGVTPWTGELRPGNHRVALQLQGHAPHTSTFELRVERALDVSLSLSPLKTEPVREPITPIVVAEPPAQGEVPALVIAGIATLGAAVVAGGVALGLELGRASKESEATDAPTQVAAAGALAEMEDLQLGARVALGLGGGIALAGGTMVLVGILTKTESAPLATSAACTGDGCSVLVLGRF